MNPQLLLAMTLRVILVLGTEEFHPRNYECSQLPKLPIPGHGWDSLQDKQMGSVFRTDYSKCKTTLDGRFLIPNNYEAIVTKSSDIQMSTDMVQHWKNYTSLTSKSFNLKLGIDLSSWDIQIQLSSSFSDDYQKVKDNMMEFGAAAVRVSIQHDQYQVLSTPSAMLNEQIEKLFYDVIDALEVNNTDRAECLLEFIVRDYGTHYVTRVHAGAMLVQENYVETLDKKQMEGYNKEIKAAAAISFLELIKLPKTNYGMSENWQMLEEYKSMTRSSRTRTFGGPDFLIGMTAKEWQERIGHDLVAIDKSGDPIFYLITPTRFPNTPPEILEIMLLQLKTVVKDYLVYNMHVGCMDPESTNFDVTANIDSPCQESYTYEGHQLGGIYIQCSLSSYRHEAGNPCKTKSQKNPLTGDFSCPNGFSSVLINSWQDEQTTQKSECDQKCSGWWIFKKCNLVCNNNWYTSYADLKSYWCSPTQSNSGQSGYMFGGAFSTTTNNAYTGRKTCPQDYFKLKLSEDSWVCVANADQKQKTEFGGFFSCKSSNPLAGNSVAISQKGCQSGFRQSIVTVDDHCQISYCYKPFPKTTQSYRNAELIRPPFKDVSSRLFQRNETQNQKDVTDYSIIAGIILFILIITAILFMALHVYRYKKHHDNDDGNKPLVITTQSSFPTATAEVPDLINNPTMVRKQNWGNVMREMKQQNIKKPMVPPKKLSLH